MVNLHKVFKQLEQERRRAQKELEHLDDAISAFGKVVGEAGRTAVEETEKTVRTVRRTLSDTGRKRIAAAQRARWAKWKRQALKKVT
jgi:polyribonucleotide nucleotidyltransferase